MASSSRHWEPCGCWYAVEGPHRYAVREYMPQIDLVAHTTILSIISRTVLTQTFVNSSTTKAIDQASYTFPLYDGVSVVGFKCLVGPRSIYGLVKEKQKARADYTEAVSRGETAGLLEQLPESSDVFTTRIGNIPANEKVVVEITYLGELKHDAEVDRVRFTIPTAIAPRYGPVSNDQAVLPSDSHHATGKGGIKITVDVMVDEGCFIRGIQSPSHPIGVAVGRTSVMAEDSNDPHRASATLSLGSSELSKDFVLLVLAKDQDFPRALLETHPKLPNQRALMATLVPRFNLPPILPEIVFVVDRSGSMYNKISTVVSALKVFLKSLPVGVKFNICSFGNDFSFLWDRSKSYDKSSLGEAMAHVSQFAANLGGTEMFRPVVETVKKRYKDMQLEVMLLTDGQIRSQQQLFDFINETVANEPVRFFSLGIGAGASHSLIEGIARAGNGFSQAVGEHEKLHTKVVRMLKGALTPHIKDYTFAVKYEKSSSDEEEYEMVEKVTDRLPVLVTESNSKPRNETSQKPVISLFNRTKREDKKKRSSDPTGQDRYDHLLTITPPKLLQAPSQIPPLHPFSRTTVYLLMSPEACQNTPKSVILRATSEHGPLELEITVQDVGKGQTIHQLAAKKAMTELEEGRGWIVEAKGDDGKMLKDRFDGRWDELVQREAVRLGVLFQVGGKWCSFVAVQKNVAQVEKQDIDDIIADYEDDAEEDELASRSLQWNSRHAKTLPGIELCSLKSDTIFATADGFGARSGTTVMPKLRMRERRWFQMRNESSVSRALNTGRPHYEEDPLVSPLCKALKTPRLAPERLTSSFHRKGHSGDRCRSISSDGNRPRSTASVDDGFAAMLCEMEDDNEIEEPQQPPSFKTCEERMYALIDLQTFDGSWGWSDELLLVLGLKQEDVGSFQGDKDTVATALAIAFLERKVPREKEAWELVVEKAKGWLQRKGMVDVEGEVERVAWVFGPKGEEKVA